jgi:TonB-dependent receptor
MARPVLANMAPSITAVSISATDGGSGSLSAGNPNLKAFRANAIDIGYEWYFDKGSVISIAAFAKYVKNNPQSQSVTGTLPSLISQDMINAILANYNCTSQPIQCANITSSTVAYTLTSYQNAPGGVLQGIELNYQQQFNFLPAPFDGFGINANYTYVASKIHYLFRDSTSSTLTDHVAPWFGASPHSFNATFYYDADTWEVRLTSSYRAKYVDTYPVKTGSAAVGYGNSPYVNQFIYGKASLYFDTSFSYSINDNVSFKLDALNLTNQHTKKYWLFNNTTPRETYDSVSGRQLFAGVTLKY